MFEDVVDVFMELDELKDTMKDVLNAFRYILNFVEEQQQQHVLEMQRKQRKS